MLVVRERPPPSAVFPQGHSFLHDSGIVVLALACGPGYRSRGLERVEPGAVDVVGNLFTLQMRRRGCPIARAGPRFARLLVMWWEVFRGKKKRCVSRLRLRDWISEHRKAAAQWLKRMQNNDDSWARLVFQWEPGSHTRQRGRQNKRWLDTTSEY